MSDKMDRDTLREALGRAFAVYSMGGLSGAMYAVDEGEGEGWAMDNDDFDRLSEAVRIVLLILPDGDGEHHPDTIEKIMAVDATLHNSPALATAVLDALTGDTE